MNQLQWQIKKLESEIDQNKKLLTMEVGNLKNYTASPQFVFVSMLSAFGFGYYLAHKNPKQLLQQAQKHASVLGGIYKGLNVFLPFIL